MRARNVYLTQDYCLSVCHKTVLHIETRVAIFRGFERCCGDKVIEALPDRMITQQITSPEAVQVKLACSCNIRTELSSSNQLCNQLSAHFFFCVCLSDISLEILCGNIFP